MSDFPTIFDWLERAEPLRGYPAAYIAIAAAAVLVAVWEWRVALLALTVHYLAAGLLFVDVLDPRLAYVKFIVGLFISLILYFTARQVNWGRPPPDLSPEEVQRWRGNPHLVRIGRFQFAAATLVRAGLAIAVTLIILNLGNRPAWQLPAVPPHVNLAIFGLLGLGLLGLGVTTEPLKAGMGLLLFMTGFELLYNALEQSATVLAALVVASVVLSLVIAYLTQVRHAPPAELDEV